jgi:hypothetical protein
MWLSVSIQTSSFGPTAASYAACASSGSSVASVVPWTMRSGVGTTSGAWGIAAARHPDDAALAGLIAQLRASSDVAEGWWVTHDVAQKRHGLKRYLHPTVGELTLHYEALSLPDDGDQILTVYAAEPDTADAERLAQLSAPAGATA